MATQVIVTKAVNGFVVELRDQGTLQVQVVNNLAQLVKTIKAAYDEVEAE